MELTNFELSKINGGLTISAALYSSMSSLLSTVFGIGQAVGSSIYRTVNGKTCKI